MPELPEVETITRVLREGKQGSDPVVGKAILSARVFWNRSIAMPGLEEFAQRISGQVIQAVGRRGKFIVFTLSSASLLMHLRMSGDVRVEPVDRDTLKHDRLHLVFRDGFRLVFNDARKFGRVCLVDDPAQILGGLGPEPFDPALNGDMFYQLLHKMHRQIKPLLLDQAFIAGVGNIYSDEALHRAKIHPLTPSDQISEAYAAALLDGIRAALEEGIRRNGASIDWVYRGGDFQNYFRVYQRTGEPCPVCGTPIERKVIGQRSTHFCPACQPQRNLL